MAAIFKKKSSRSGSDKPEKAKQGFPWFKFILGLSALLFSASLLTPYPAALIRAIKGTPEEIIIQEPDSTEEDLPEDLNNPEPVQAEPDTGSALPDVIPAPPDKDVEPPPPLDANAIPGLDQSSEVGDLSVFRPFRFPTANSTYTLVMPPLPPIIPDGPSDDAVWDVNEIARGLSFKSELTFKEGTLASKDRLNNRNYEVHLKMEIVKPTALSKAKDFDNVNPHLSKIFPQFNTLITNSKVSGFYHQLMNQKHLELRKSLTKLNKLLTRHNYYDCETILEITAPQSKRKVLWIQADMDVVSDGTDGDRLPKMPAEIVNSSNYQPFTSYRWPKVTKNPNPLLAVWQKRLKAAKAKPALAQNKASIQHMERGIQDMKSNSFLIAEYDPFVVIPLGILNNSNSSFSPSPGDYAVVIVGNKLYPAIVGDAGPRYKIGEASLRLAREINSNSSPYKRPVSDLTVSYVVFPKSASKPRQAPNYALWKEECTKLLNEMGGISANYKLHDWVDLLAPAEPATPAPAPAQTPASPTPARPASTTPTRR